MGAACLYCTVRGLKSEGVCFTLFIGVLSGESSHRVALHLHAELSPAHALS